jgi:hypothetical protein
MNLFSQDLTNYADDDVPTGPRLSTYPLDTQEWRQAFLERLFYVGYVGVMEATAHVYDLLAPPKEYRCALIGQLTGMAGTGKLVIYTLLTRFLEEMLSMEAVPGFHPNENLEHWHARVRAKWDREWEREKHLIGDYATLLNGELPGQAHAISSCSMTVVRGAWRPSEDRSVAERAVSAFAQRWAAQPLSMANADVRRNLFESMLEDARDVEPGAGRPRQLAELIDMWTEEFRADNPAYQTNWSCVEAQSIFLRIMGYGVDTPAEDFDAPRRELLTEIITNCVLIDEQLSDWEIEADTRAASIEAWVQHGADLLSGPVMLS